MIQICGMILENVNSPGKKIICTFIRLKFVQGQPQIINFKSSLVLLMLETLAHFRSFTSENNNVCSVNSY